MEIQNDQLNMIACWLESFIHALFEQNLLSLMQPEALTFYCLCVGLLRSLSLSLCVM